jgi:hypothetical protein
MARPTWTADQARPGSTTVDTGKMHQTPLCNSERVCGGPGTTCRMHAHPGWSDRPGVGVGAVVVRGASAAVRACAAARCLQRSETPRVCCTPQRPAEVEARETGRGWPLRVLLLNMLSRRLSQDQAWWWGGRQRWTETGMRE